MEITGNIKLINETQNIGTNGFRKRELLLVTEEQYPQILLIEFTQDKCDLLDAFKVKDAVTININIRGREWVNPEGVSKFFNSFNGWRIGYVKQDGVTPDNTSENSTVPPVKDSDLGIGDDAEDWLF